MRLIEMVSTLVLVAVVGFQVAWHWRATEIKRLQRLGRADRGRLQLLMLKLGLAGVAIEDVPAVAATVRVKVK